jgi:hypothetical protein
MAHFPHDSYLARISCDPSFSSPAPVHEGKLSGYFDDDITRLLLGLGPQDTLLHSGTYGSSEPGVRPVSFTIVRERIYDQLLLPFVPRDHTYHSTQISMYKDNKQFGVHAATLKSLEEDFNKALIDAQVAAGPASLSLPNYAFALIPKLRFHSGGETQPFQYQFQKFFSPSALRARGVRIGRVTAILDAFTNLALRLTANPVEWMKGPPVGIQFDIKETSESDRNLLRAYQALGIPIFGELPDSLEELPLQEARDTLLGKPLGKTPARFLIDEIMDALNGDDDDALDFSTLDPQYHQHGYRADGVRKTRADRQDDEADDFADYVLNRREEENVTAPSGEPAPPYTSVAPIALATSVATPVSANPDDTAPAQSSALQVTLGNVETSSPVSPQILTPGSISTSISATGTTSTSASSAPLRSGADSSLRQRSTVAARRAREYSGPYRTPRTSTRGPQTSRAPSGPTRPHFRGRSPSPMRRSSPRRPASPHQHYSSSRRSPSPEHRRPGRRPPSPRTAPLIPFSQGSLAGTIQLPRVVQTQERQALLRDTDTGAMTAVSIIEAPFSRLGVSVLAPTTQSSSDTSRNRAEYRSSRGSSPPRRTEESRWVPRPRSRSPPPSRPYRQRSRSPPQQARGYYPERRPERRSTRLPSPRRDNLPRRQEPVRRQDAVPPRRAGPSQNYARINTTSTSDPAHTWGESSPAAPLAWGKDSSSDHEET